jgi:hypothetical protein
MIAQKISPIRHAPICRSNKIKAEVRSFKSESMEALSPEEDECLRRHEDVILKHLGAFLNVGNALMAIRDGKLYRSEFQTFAEYCRKRWDISRVHAHRLLKAAEITQTVLLPMGNILPENERQIRPLISLPEDQIRAVWKRAIKEAGPSKPTASLISRIAQRLYMTVDPILVQGLCHWQKDIQALLSGASKAVAAGELDRAAHDLEQARIRLEVEIQKANRESLNI